MTPGFTVIQYAKMWAGIFLRKMEERNSDIFRDTELVKTRRNVPLTIIACILILCLCYVVVFTSWMWASAAIVLWQSELLPGEAFIIPILLILPGFAFYKSISALSKRNYERAIFLPILAIVLYYALSFMVTILL